MLFFSSVFCLTTDDNYVIENVPFETKSPNHTNLLCDMHCERPSEVFDFNIVAKDKAQRQRSNKFFTILSRQTESIKQKLK